ncbi:putative damage-inducible protein DinB [Friedmanniella endophytica]|uniref:Putative damage-inducible protein DinB n=1 Tax=Microlunatus kandeliicorticis TaxID=1759536 RepID=A0A7W3IRU6_9ACTN|nr:DUF664 domain-containing protein [Microlunatus kandeliicorticis]MBA8794108.1 putative damage-inducible protein DinB [Microlunatus kandeliicorticis]
MEAADRTERDALEHFLDANRAAVTAVVDGLADADARRSVVPTGWTPLELMVHLGGVERHWFLRVVRGDRSDRPAHHGPLASLADATAAYRAECARSRQILERFGLDDAVSFDQPADLVGEVRTVRDVVLHVIEETARHAGHLDIPRELLDGRTGLGPR